MEQIKSFTYTPAPKTAWDNLSLAEKAEMMKVAVRNGITDLPTIRKKYNEFAEGGKVEEKNLYPIGGLLPGINAPAAISGAAKAVTEEVRQRLYDNVSPFGYNNPVERIASAVFLNKPSDKQEYAGNRDILDDLWGTYLGIPRSKRHYDPVLTKSKYKPTKASNPDATYYSIPYSNEDKDYIIREALWDEGNNQLLNPELGTFTIGQGRDKKGQYVSYYDNWNINPFKGITNVGNKVTSLLGLDNVEDLSFGLGKPVEVYDRIYLDDYYGIPKEHRGGSFLPEVVVEGRKHSDGGSIHIKPENRGKFTALKERTGHSASWFKEHGTPAQKKMATFALNARKWKHSDGGYINLFGEGGDENPMNYEYRGTVYDNNLKKQGITHVAELPEITITGRRPLNQRPYVSSFNPDMGLEIFSPVAENVLSGASTLFGGAMYYGLYPFMKLGAALTPTETEEERKERVHAQNIEDRPYTRYIDAVRNEKRSEPSDPLYQSRLGLLGLTPDNDSENIWHLKDSLGNNIKECAEFANHFNSMIGKPTTGDAWTTNGIYGDSLIYGGTSARTKYPALINIPRMLSKRITDVDRDNLETGDIVDLYSPFSHYAQRASREGRGNSHTGRIYKPEGKEGPTYIIHNVGGDINVEPIGDFLNSLGTWQITRIARPGTKDKPYKKE